MKVPVVSIGMPVYNGENYLAETLDSILSQTYQDFELIISDNASTDQTQAICEAYAANDARIRYYRNAENLGAARNYNLLVDLARGQYFKWAAHDDLLGTEFLERCVEILDTYSEVVLCYPRTKAIDEQGEIIRDYPAKPKGASDKAHERFHEFVVVPHPCVAVFGLIRLDQLRKTRLIGSYTGADRPLLSELSLRGQLYEIPDFLFYYRNHTQQSWQGQGSYRQQRVWYNPNHKVTFSFPHWRVLWEHLRSIKRVPLSLYERLHCYGLMVWWIRRRWRYLARNLILQD